MSGSMITNNANDPSLNEIGHYVVTSHPPGSVLSAVRCSFFGDGSVVRLTFWCHVWLNHT